MRVPMLWIPPAQSFEDALLAERIERTARTAERLLLRSPALVRSSSPRSLGAEAHSILARWEILGAEPAVPTGMDRYVEYDVYFSIRRRTDREPLTALGEAAVVAYHRLLVDMHQGTRLEPHELGRIERAFAAIFALLSLDVDADSARTSDTMPVPVAFHGSTHDEHTRGPIDALLRWRLGHHSFFVLIQVLMVVHLRIATSLNRYDLAAAAGALALAAGLWEGTAAAFRFAADFASDDYENIVRPSMSPPFLKEGFSGFFSADHVGLIRILKGLRPALQQLPPELGAVHQTYLRALDLAYEAHACVCENFVGAGSSLRGGQRENSASGPAFIRHTLKPRALASAGASWGVGQPHEPVRALPAADPAPSQKST